MVCRRSVCFLKKLQPPCSLFKPISRLGCKNNEPSDTKGNAETPHKGKDLIQEMYVSHNSYLYFAENTRMLVKWGDLKIFLHSPSIGVLLLLPPRLEQQHFQLSCLH